MVLAAKQKRPISIHHKRRIGQHHKITKNYTKPYWPYLPIVFIIVCGITANSLWTHHQKNVLGYATNLSNTELLFDTNNQRAAAHDSPLHLSSELNSAAQAKANDMARLNFWSHISPSGIAPWQLITQAGYSYVTAGENLAYGFSDSQDIIRAWMNSPEHRINILNTDYRDIGFGIANAPDYVGTGPETIVVAEYAQPTTGLSASALPDNQQHLPTTVASQTSSVARLTLLTNAASATVVSVLLIAICCSLLVLLRHSLAWRRALRDGEQFAVRYHVLDVVLVVTGVLGFLLTRSAGMIH
ncbi:MAG TPA: CAP domain-containing protein [Candidatus Saccharimonadales bacterium]|nr:CAP domain-containing protein [Candidatus Saccharimonadales bacterium]